MIVCRASSKCFSRLSLVLTQRRWISSIILLTVLTLCIGFSVSFCVFRMISWYYYLNSNPLPRKWKYIPTVHSIGEISEPKCRIVFLAPGTFVMRLQIFLRQDSGYPSVYGRTVLLRTCVIPGETSLYYLKDDSVSAVAFLTDCKTLLFTARVRRTTGR